ncbi:MAG: PDZ domain-containing protein [Phycisphaerales bacterium]|nr:PDZ domain-containing protein [Phycisphaerales bacterium]
MASSWPVLLHGETDTATPVPASPRNTLDEATIKALDADAWPVREAATFRLLRDETLTPDAIAKVFGQKLSAEQRLRLMQVAEHHLIRVMAKRVVAVPTTASLGVALEWLVPEEVAELGRPGTRVEATLPGFPAFGVLQPGDLIYALNSKGIDPAVMGEAMVHEMRDMIQQYQAGDTVELTILRDGQPRQLKVTLGSLDAMRTLYEPDTLVLQPLAAKEWARFREGLVGESPTKPSPKQ